MQSKVEIEVDKNGIEDVIIIGQSMFQLYLFLF